MRLIFPILALFTVVAFYATPASAQIYGTGKTPDSEMAPQGDFQARPYYNQMVRDALRNKPSRFDFMKFRIFYSQTPQYDPISTTALDQMNDYAYIVMNDSDPERVKSAILAYQTVVSNHLANLDVVLQAISLSKQDKRFGNPAFFQWMRDGLMKSVVISGSGYSLQQAYDVITMQEETMLLRRLGFRPTESVQRKEGIIFYNMHTVMDPKTGKERTIFVNTSIPMRVLEMREKNTSKNLTLDIRKQ